MIFEHEIPSGSRLYFGENAKLKRNLENFIGNILFDEGYEEIVTPIFSYYQHQSIEDETKLIKISDECNNQIALRADSTLDAVRIITKRLGRTTSHKKWFYIQPVFEYPSNEHNQIGCEWIEHNEVCDVIHLATKIIHAINVAPVVQVSNINIPRLIIKHLGLDENIFLNNDLNMLFNLKLDWLSELLVVQSVQSLEAVLAIIPEFLHDEVTKLLNVAQKIDYERVVIAPLYQCSLKYYNDIYFRIFENNQTIIKGGRYTSQSTNNEVIDSLGFAIYTDNLLKTLEEIK